MAQLILFHYHVSDVCHILGERSVHYLHRPIETLQIQDHSFMLKVLHICPKEFIYLINHRVEIVRFKRSKSYKALLVSKILKHARHNDDLGLSPTIIPLISAVKLRCEVENTLFLCEFDLL